MKFSELLDKKVSVEGLNVGKITDVIVDMEELKMTHLEIELTKEASEQILGVTPSMFKPGKNTLAMSALEKGAACCTDKGVELKVSKGQLAIYLRPA
jgi:sporulation protein YlmC with PRC-barrel domain